MGRNLILTALMLRRTLMHRLIPAGNGGYMTTNGKAASAAKGKPRRKFSRDQKVQVLTGRSKTKLGKIDDVDMDSEDRPYLVTWLTSYSGGWFNEQDLKAA